MKKIALLTLLLINLSLSFSLPRNQASPAIFSVTQSAGTILFRHTDSTQTIIPCQSVASIVSNADPSKVVSVWVVQQGDYDKIMQFDYSVCGFSTKQEAVDSVTVWASCLYVSDSAYTTILYTNTDSATITSYDVLNSQNAPPVSPATGDTYLVGTSPSGAWIGHAKDIAEWNGSSWDFTDGVQGDFLYNATNALTYIFRSGNWVQTTGIPALNKGNSISNGLTIGTNNAKALTFETNNTTRGNVSSTGTWTINNLSGSGNRLLLANSSGALSPVTLGSNLSFAGTTLNASGSGGVSIPSTDSLEFFADSIVLGVNSAEYIGVRKKASSFSENSFINGMVYLSNGTSYPFLGNKNASINVDENENVIAIHTGGWSENEELIEEFKETAWWFKFHVITARGGHYYFNTDSHADKEWKIVVS